MLTTKFRERRTMEQDEITQKLNEIIVENGGEVLGCTPEVLDVPEYNPNGWNEYPKVIPTTQRFMRLEVINSDYGREATYIYKAQFKNGLWIYGDYIVKIKDGDRVRFRPWED